MNTLRSLPRIGAARIPPTSTSWGCCDTQDRIQDAVIFHLKGEWMLHRGSRTKAVWKDVQRKRLRLSASDLERIGKSVRPKAQRATAAVIEILTACRRERRQAERRRA